MMQFKKNIISRKLWEFPVTTKKLKSEKIDILYINAKNLSFKEYLWY